MAAENKILVIVESPSKAKTIGKYLGTKYKVIASVGHVRDLPKSKIGIDIDNNFEPNYINIRGKGDFIKELKKEAKKASRIILATDPDREGEAISWHIAYLLGIDLNEACRVEFNEITKKTVKEAIKKPRKIAVNLVDAQQARRVLDRLVGYQISPLLWRKIRTGLSAGRVQSAALKIICDRQREIDNFISEEYWNISVAYKKGKTFSAKLSSYKGKKIKISSKDESDKVVEALKSKEHSVIGTIEKIKKKKPAPPFTTSSLQQEASNKLNFNTKKTMSVAQQLYEGVSIKGQGFTGLITYLRTDSVRISSEAREAAADFIKNKYGSEYSAYNVYSNKKKDIQDAHEAIRPSIIHMVPEDIKESLTNDQYKLYKLIWSRFMASQMAEATFKAKQTDIACGDYELRATGIERLFDGYQKVYDNLSDDEKNRLLPDVDKGEILKVDKVVEEQAFTQPPARYTEAGLVRELEDKNIGRPSTYAPIITTLIQRKYVVRDKKALVATELGFVVDNLMEEYFKNIVDVGFTAKMEDELDNIELSKRGWKDVIAEFYGPFSKELEEADNSIEKVKLEDKPTGELCELCGKPMVIKSGRFGDFIACSGYPECKNTKPIVQSINVSCPECGKGMVARRSKRGRVFYGCSAYPECKCVFWDKPTEKICPLCGSRLVEKKGKNHSLVCSNKECSYKE